MAGSAFEDDEVVERMQRFTPILVDGAEHGDVLRRFGAPGFPSVVFCDEAGSKQHMVVGAVPTAHFLGEVDKAIEKVFGD